MVVRIVVDSVQAGCVPRIGRWSGDGAELIAFKEKVVMASMI